MGPKATYELYLALKLHFTSDYNFFKYNGKIPAKVVDSLDKDKKAGMKLECERIGKLRDPQGFILANILADPDWTPHQSRDDRSKARYNELKKRTQGLRYQFEQDLGKLPDNLDVVYGNKQGTPSLLLTWMAGSISVETVAIMMRLLDRGTKWIAFLREQQHPMLPTVIRLAKYGDFLEFDAEVYRDVLIEKFGCDSPTNDKPTGKIEYQTTTV
jgi:hypothetical protein